MNTLFTDILPPSGPGPGEPRHSLLFGLLPPVDVAHRAFELAQGLKRSGKLSGPLRPPHVLHISLARVAKELAEPPPSGLTDFVCARAERVRQRPFDLSLSRIKTWGRAGSPTHVVAVGDDGVVGVETLHQRLAEALGAPKPRRFEAHMTLLYGGGPSTPLPIPPITWAVREFALIHSFVGLTRYEVVARFPLSA